MDGILKNEVLMKEVPIASSLDVGDQVFDAYFPMGVGIPNAYFQNKYAIDFGYGIYLERYATIRNTGDKRNEMTPRH
jgi:hypothetical protein